MSEFCLLNADIFFSYKVILILSENRVLHFINIFKLEEENQMK